MKLSIIALSLLGLITFGCAKSPASNDQAKEIATLKTEVEKLKVVLNAVARVDVDEVYTQIQAQKEQEKKVHDIPALDSPVAGNPNAAITITEFSDFQCPYCAMRNPMIQDLLKKYPTQIKIVYKHFPLSFHKEAPAAHAAGIAAHKQGKFWEYRFELTKDAKALKFDSTSLVKVAQTVGLNIEQFTKEMALAGANQATINRDMELGAKVGVQGTPTYFVNGKYAPQFSPDMVEQLVKNAK